MEGVEASRSIAVPVIVSTVFTIVPYVVAVRYAFPVLGVLEGTLVGYAVAIPSPSRRSSSSPVITAAEPRSSSLIHIRRGII